MKNLIPLYLLLFLSLNVFSQQKEKTYFSRISMSKDKYCSVGKNLELLKKNSELKKIKAFPNYPIATEICTNGGFEDHENIGGENVLKNFNTEEFIGNFFDTSIPTLTQSNSKRNCVTVPSNYIDQFIGNINGFGQKTLRVGRSLNHNTSAGMEIDLTLKTVHTYRYKNNNETELLFNYKAIFECTNHSEEEKPYFRARIINNNEEIVSEFALIANQDDCNFSYTSGTNSGLDIGYTNEWQTCKLDISSIPNLQNFRIEFISGNCLYGVHFAYVYIDDLCIQHSNYSNQGSIALNPLTVNCPTTPLNVCGTFTVPNTGVNTTTVSSIILNIFNENQNIVYTNSNPTNIDLVNKTFCFDLNLSNFPNIVNSNYNVGVVINYGNLNTNCISNIPPAIDNDAGPGFDITFNNCDYTCDIVTQNFSTSVCDLLDDNIEINNLSQYRLNLANSLNYNFNYYSTLNGAQNQIAADKINNFTTYNLVQGNNIIYVRVLLSNICFQIATLTLELVSKPIIPINDIEPLCEGKEIIINAGNNYDSYTWSTGETSQSITITQGGNYSVTVTENHGTTICSSTKNFTVVTSNIANIQEVINTDWTDQNNTITVLLNSSSQGNYEYSINGSDFQDSNTFTNLEIGEYTVYVRDKNGCGMVSEAVYLLTYPKFFTPNGDGFNDYWKIKFSEKEANLMVKVFDRYGKFLKQFGTNSIGWDGKDLGKDLPSSDYWFVVTRENGKEYKGHFSLKR